MKFLVLTLLVLAATSLALTAKPVTIPDEPITLAIPDDWRELPAPAGMLYCAAGGPYALQLIKAPNSRNIDLNPAVIANIKRSMSERIESRGGTVTFGDEGPRSMGGAPAYVINASYADGAQNAQVSLYVVDANQSLYLLNLMTTGTVPDPTLQGVADSFAFTSPPALPQSTLERRAYKLGLIAGVLLVVGLVAVGIFLAVRRR